MFVCLYVTMKVLYMHLSDIQDAYDKFPDFLCMGTFIDSTHMKL